MDPLLKTVLLRSLAFLLWILFSAWLFSIVEYTDKDDVEEKYQLLLSLYDSMASKYNMTIDEFNNFSNLAHEALIDPKPQWSYSAAVDFVFQSLTTIGYGYITPQTPTGQILCIFVCLLGIPMTLLTLKSVGELDAKLVNAIVTKVEKKILKRAEPKQVEVKCAVILFSTMVVTLLIAACLAMILWGYTFVEGLYFWFITLTTVGFGDFVPSRSRLVRQSIKSINATENHLNKDESANVKETPAVLFLDLLFLILCMIGLVVVSGVLNSIMTALDVNEQNCRLRCIRCVPRHKRQNHVDNEQHNIPQQEEAEMKYLGTIHFLEGGRVYRLMFVERFLKAFKGML
ncbi:potassium channel subfamily K member 15-like [Oculina patagonica]